MPRADNKDKLYLTVTCFLCLCLTSMGISVGITFVRIFGYVFYIFMLHTNGTNFANKRLERKLFCKQL